MVSSVSGVLSYLPSENPCFDKVSSFHRFSSKIFGLMTISLLGRLNKSFPLDFFFELTSAWYVNMENIKKLTTQ